MPHGEEEKVVVSPEMLLGGLWREAGLPGAALSQIHTSEEPSRLVTSFQVGLAGQVSIAAAALAAESLFAHRTGSHQTVQVSRSSAELECTGYFQVDGKTPEAWEKYSGLYATQDGFVRIHANFAHHRDGVLGLLGLPVGEIAEREQVSAALASWSAVEFEEAAAQRGLVVAKARSFEAWDAHPHALATRDDVVVRIRKLGDAPPRPLPESSAHERPLNGIKILDLTRILAGPVWGAR